MFISNNSRAKANSAQVNLDSTSKQWLINQSEDPLFTLIKCNTSAIYVTFGDQLIDQWQTIILLKKKCFSFLYIFCFLITLCDLDLEKQNVWP